jgi:hypothetical protein
MKLWKDHIRLIKHLRLAGVLSVFLLAGCGGPLPEGPAPDKPKGQGGSREIPAEVRKSQEKLKQIGAAFHKDQLKIPLGYATRDGRLSLSWRVALLPKLGYEDLFKRFHLYEPWDSPHNLALLADMPEVFRPVKGTAKHGYTYYRGFVGDMALFPPRTGTNFKVGTEGKWYIPLDYQWARIIDGFSYTFLVVEGGEPVPWTQPEELSYDPNKPLPRLGGLFDGDFNACFCDGSVHLIPRTAPENLLRALITPQGQERVDLSEIGLPDPIRGPGAGKTEAGRGVQKQNGAITGKVTYKGVPLPGGTVTFHAANGGRHVARIDANGAYELQDVPTGFAQVAVETLSAKDGPGAGANGSRFVQIPAKYGSPTTSSLSYEIKASQQKFDINLAD